MNKEQITILGSGSWGNTLAYLLGQNQKVVLWDRDAGRVRRANKTRRFKKPVTKKYPDNVVITNKLEEALESKIIVNCISLKGVAEVFSNISVFQSKKDQVFVNASKGIDSINLQTPTEIIQSFCKNVTVAAISGPNLAKELIEGQPMVTEVAAKKPEIAELIREQIASPTLRVYVSTDIKGLELCGALKNVIAIAAGASDSLKLGESAKASLITRGLKEMGEFLKLYGCKEETLLGPAGVGDLIATCSGALSRNYRVGFYLAEGKRLNQIISKLGEVAEGVNTAKAIHKICLEKNIQLPIVEQIYKLVEGEISAVDAVISLMKRPVKR